MLSNTAMTSSGVFTVNDAAGDPMANAVQQS